MNESEEVIQKNIFVLADHLPKHKNSWEILQPEIRSLLQKLTDQSEELTKVQSVRRLEIENFEEMKIKLITEITEEIDETLLQIKDKIDTLKKANNEIKNVIDKLEESSLKIDWDSEAKVLQGNAQQPPLGPLLECCLTYRTFFLKQTEEIVQVFNKIDVESIGNRELMDELAQSFDVDLENHDVAYLIALTQYIKK